MGLALPPAVADFLAAHHVMTLATVGPAGPWASAVFYAGDGDGLIFLSAPTTRHGANLAGDARCAAAIQDDTGDWTAVRGVQVEGRVDRLAGAAADEARRRYAAKFPVVGGAVPPPVAAALARVAWYRLVPGRLLFIDNSRGFGHREEFCRQ